MGAPRKLSDFGDLSEAEDKVLAGLDEPDVTSLGDGTLPGADSGDDRRVRASFIRWCALGAGDGRRLHEAGLRVAGALLVSDGAGAAPGLNLEGCTLPADLALLRCRFEQAPLLLGARIRSLFLNGAALPGLIADGLRAEGGVFLRDGFHATGGVRLAGARLGGDLVCGGGRFEAEEGPALHADGLQTEGGVFLSDGFRAKGAVRFPGARLGGDLACGGGRFEAKEGPALLADRLQAEGGVFLRDGFHATGAVRLPGARLGGHLACDGGRFEAEEGPALFAQQMRAEGILFWRNGAEAQGLIDLKAARFGAIADDPACWSTAPGSLALDRLEYGAFLGGGVSAEARLDWLSRQIDPDKPQEFRPQPWEQCARVLREMGHPEDAREILIDKERRQRADRRRRMGPRWRRGLLAASDALLDQTVRFGHRSLRAFGWLAAIWAVSFTVFFLAWRADAMKPNNVFVLRAPEWVGCAATAPPWTYRGPATSQLDCFLRQPEAQGFAEFNAAIYAADVLFPLVEIEQQAHWTPDVWWGRLTMWLAIILGWGLSLLAVAGFSGLVKSD